MATHFVWTVLLIGALSVSYAYANNTDDQALGTTTTATTSACGPEVVNGGQPVRLNEPSLLSQLDWIDLPGVPTIQQMLTEAPFTDNNNVFIPVTTEPMTAANMKRLYSLGFKLYKFHNLDTGQVQVHQFQHNKYRGILTYDNFARAMTEKLKVRGFRDDNARKRNEVTEFVFPGGHSLKGIKQLMYPHKLPRVPGDGLPKSAPASRPDTSLPAFEVRFNTDVEYLLKRCGEAERRDIDAVTKQPRVDEEGRVAMSTSTWFTEEVQRVVAEMVASGDAYTIGVYTTRYHPHVIATREAPGKLVGGIASIHVNGVSTGLTLFMDRTRELRENGKPGQYVYDGAGKLAFAAEVFHTFDSGALFLDTVTVNEAAKIMGSVLIPREEYLRHVLAAQADPKPLHIQQGVYELPFDRFEKARFYAHLGIEPPVPNVSKKKPKDKRPEQPGGDDSRVTFTE